MSASRERARNFLAYGFGISIAVHLIVLPFVHPQATVAEEGYIDPVGVDHRMPTPPPTPPPTPKPTVPPTQPPHAPPPQQHPVQQRPPQIHAPPQDSRPHGGAGEPRNTHTLGDPNANPAPPGTPVARAIDGEAPAQPVATPTATPKPTPTPLSCTRPNVAATTLRALEPDTPVLAQQQGISGVVQVVVSLDAQSRVVGTRIQSSPSAVLNQAALAAARGSQFRTEVKNCEPIAADYVFSVDFTAQ